MAWLKNWLQSGANSLTWGVVAQFTTPVVIAALEAWYFQHRGLDWGVTLTLAAISFAVAFLLATQVKQGFAQTSPRGRSKAAKGKPWLWIVVILGGLLIFDVFDRAVQHFSPKINPARGKADKIAAHQIAGRPWASEEELKQSHITDRTFFLYDIPRDDDNVSIDHRIFERCTILGPAIVYLDSGIMVESIFASEGLGVDGILWPNPKPATGIVVLRACTFKNCTTRWIGVAGEQDTLAKMKKAVAGQ